MSARETHPSSVGAQPSWGSEPIVGRRRTRGERDGRHLRRTVAAGAAGVLVAAAVVAGALSLSSGSGSARSTGPSPSSAVAGLSCYLPSAHAASPSELAEGAAGVTTAGPEAPPRQPALYGLEQIGAHLLCR